MLELPGGDSPENYKQIPVIEICFDEIKGVIDPIMEGMIVCAGVVPPKMTEGLWALVWAEFVGNGRKTLSSGKVRFLRRKERRISSLRL